jgi:hypothetical protein
MEVFMGEVVSFDEAFDARHRERMAEYGDQVVTFLDIGCDVYDLDRPDAAFVVLLEVLLEVRDASKAGHDKATDLLEWFRDFLSDSDDAQAD